MPSSRSVADVAALPTPHDAAAEDDCRALVSVKGAIMVIACFCLGMLIPHLLRGSNHPPNTHRGGAPVHRSTTVLSSGLVIEETIAPLGATKYSNPPLEAPQTARPLGGSSSLPSVKLREFSTECDRLVSSVPHMPWWSPNATLHDEFLTRGERLFCTQGRRLYRDFPSVSNWTLPRGNTELFPIADAVWYNDSDVRLVLRHRVAVVTTTLLSMFHMLNDFVLPWPFILEQIIKASAPGQDFPTPTGSTDWLKQLPLDYILLNVPGTIRGTGSDDITFLTIGALVPPHGELRTLVLPDSLADTTVHCYCRALLQMPSFLITYPKTAQIADGDVERRRWTRHFQTSIGQLFAFLPYGTHPVPFSEVSMLWPNQSTAPRLLFYLRGSSRHIYPADEIAARARAVGFQVLVFFPERHNVSVQARAARYADVVMGIHGQALTWISLMDSRHVPHCRELIELQHYGRPFKRVHNVYELLAADNSLRYTRIAPVNVVFDPKKIPLIEQRKERKNLMRRSFPHELLGFYHQTALYDVEVVGKALEESFARVSECISLQKPIPRSALPPGGAVWKL